MENYFLDSKCCKYVEEFADSIRATLYYGSARQYSICLTGVKINGNKDKAIKEAFKRIAETKKYITPISGCTEYI